VRTIVVTGGSMGIGRAVAEHLAARGDRIVLVARGREALEATAAALEGEGHLWRSLDVADDDAWNREDFPADIDGLVCSAGLMEPIGPLETYEFSALRRTIDVNVVGTLLAIRRFASSVRSRAGGIVTFGGGGATAPLPHFDAYAASKAAVARLTENLVPVLDPARINCVAPGFVATRLHQQTLEAGRNKAGAAFYERTAREVEGGGFPVEAAAELVEFLLSGVAFSGKLISAQWDPWRDSAFQERLAADADLATIRRIDESMFGRLPPND
jgi:NAD(P)-dependent dehydrogenase (short-subunit alcohol dehydrogenase family)